MMNPWQGLGEPLKFTLPAKAAPIKAEPKRSGFPPEVVAAYQKRCAEDRAKNPWNLTPAELRALDAIYRTKGRKQAARDLGLSVKTIDGRMTEIHKKMGSANRMFAVLAYARWKWEAQGATA